MLVGSIILPLFPVKHIVQYIYTITYNVFFPIPEIITTFIYQEQEIPWTTSTAFFLENSNTNFSYSPCETFPSSIYKV